MNIRLLARKALLLACFASFAQAQDFERKPIWDGPAPGDPPECEQPTLEIHRPSVKSSDVFLLVFPGGGYASVNIAHEGLPVARYFNEKGIVVGILKYRTPPRPGVFPRHLPALQDAKRAVRIIRSRAKELGIDPEKIGVMGFSAGGHLALVAATGSRRDPSPGVDSLESISCHLNFAVPVYPAYVLNDGLYQPNKNRGVGATLSPDFDFDDRTPPMCLIHGGADGYSPLNSLAIFNKLFEMSVPAELHVYAGAGHAFPAYNPDDSHVGNWLDRVYAWLQAGRFIK